MDHKTLPPTKSLAQLSESKLRPPLLPTHPHCSCTFVQIVHYIQCYSKPSCYHCIDAYLLFTCLHVCCKKNFTQTYKYEFCVVIQNVKINKTIIKCLCSCSCLKTEMCGTMFVCTHILYENVFCIICFKCRFCTQTLL